METLVKLMRLCFNNGIAGTTALKLMFYGMVLGVVSTGLRLASINIPAVQF